MVTFGIDEIDRYRLLRPQLLQVNTCQNAGAGGKLFRGSGTLSPDPQLRVSQQLSAPNEEKRLNALKRYSILDTLPELAFDELSRLAMHTAGAPIAAISFIDDRRVWFKSRQNFSPVELPREDSFATITIQQTEVLRVPDTVRDPRFRHLKLVLQEPHIRAYYGVPLLTMDGMAIGTLEIKFLEPITLPDSTLETLKIVARQVMTQLELRRHLVQLSRIFEDQRRAEDALRTSEAFFQALVESLPQRIIRKDLQGRFTFASRNFCTELNRSLEEIRGKTDADFFPPELARKYHADDERVIAARQPFEAVEEHLRPDGTKGFVQVVKTPLIDARGQVVGVQGIFWDVTEQRRTEQQLAHERDLLRALLDHIPDRIFFKDVQSRFIRCSASMFSSLGFNRPEEVIGKTDFNYYPANLAQGYFEEEQRIIATGEPLINKVQQHGDAQGQEVWSAVTKVPIYNHRGNITGIIGLSRDITQLKKTEQALRQTEENYRNIVENSVEGIFQTTLDGHYLSANRSLAAIYGYDSKEELISAMTDIQHQLYVDPNRREEFRRLMREKGGVTGFESEIYKKNGNVIWISESARSVTDVRGNFLYYEGSVEDITARKLAEKAREGAREAALESARVKAQFLANMSHEFRTPLNAIIGNASMLLAGRLSEDQRELLEPIFDSAEALNRLINDILDFSKIEAGKLTLEQTEFDLVETIEGTAEMLAQAARNQKNELVCQIAASVPRTVTGDPVRIRQVLMNLLSNAVKFTRNGEVNIQVAMEQQTGTKARLRFDVRDTGIGISEKARPIIFQAFTQADGSTTRKFGGTGLGLTISKQIVELMDGHIGFESEVGKGSTFWFDITLTVPEGAASGPARSNLEALAGKRLVAIDDHEGTLRVLHAYATELGLDVATFASATLALAELEKAAQGGNAPQLVLVDLEMPEMDGLSLIQALHTKPGTDHIRLVVMTPLGCRLDPAVMYSHRVSLCLVKPVKRTRLADALRNALTQPLTPPDPSEVALPAPQAKLADHASPGLVPPSPLRILLAEDNPVNQQVAARMLKSLGYAADIAANGHEVLTALEQKPYDIVLLDCQMPEMDGYEAARQITQLRQQGDPRLKSDPLLIAVTANAMTGDRERCLSAGMHDYLSKPLKLDALGGVLARVQHQLGTSLGSGLPAAEEQVALPGEERMDLSVIEGLRTLREPDQPDPLRQLVDLFLRDSHARIQALEESLQADDAHKATAAAHALKGSASNLGARRLAALCNSVEKHTKAGELSAAKPLLEPLKEEFLQVQDFLHMEVSR